MGLQETGIENGAWGNHSNQHKVRLLLIRLIFYPSLPPCQHGAQVPERTFLASCAFGRVKEVGTRADAGNLSLMKSV
jgi:hypothetical protein